MFSYYFRYFSHDVVNVRDVIFYSKSNNSPSLPAPLSDPYEQVVLPGDGLKEEEPVEPYQKIGPSKTVCCTIVWLFSQTHFKF